MRISPIVATLSGFFGLCIPACGDDTNVDPATTSGDASTSSATPMTTAVDSSGSGVGSESAGTLSAEGSAEATTESPSSTGPASECGNDAIEADEACDGSDLGAQTCESQGFDGGELACDDDCSAFDTSGCTLFTCGNSFAEGKESCDGPDLGGASCTSEGFDSGTLACDPSCAAFDTSACGTCGNVIVDGDEACDDIVLFGQTCISQGFDSGALGCQPDCLGFDTLGCGTCGNGLIDGGESCDSTELGPATCQSEGFDSGSLGCDGDCGLDTASCGICGNDILDGTEICDGDDIGANTCVTEGFDSGPLLCTPGDCLSFNTSGCGICGNGIVDGFEACDDGNMDDFDGCPNNCVGPNRLIFATSVMFNGDLGGLLGADAECQALAVAAGLPGSYMAWLSTDTESPSTRMTQSTTPYVRPDGVQVAPDWAGLVDGSLDAPIDVTEVGGAVPLGNTSCAGGGCLHLGVLLGVHEKGRTARPRLRHPSVFVVSPKTGSAAKCVVDAVYC